MYTFGDVGVAFYFNNKQIWWKRIDLTCLLLSASITILSFLLVKLPPKLVGSIFFLHRFFVSYSAITISCIVFAGYATQSESLY
jgi:hypothetical protein